MRSFPGSKYRGCHPVLPQCTPGHQSRPPHRGIPPGTHRSRGQSARPCPCRSSPPTHPDSAPGCHAVGSATLLCLQRQRPRQTAHRHNVVRRCLQDCSHRRCPPAHPHPRHQRPLRRVIGRRGPATPVRVQGDTSSSGHGIHTCHAFPEGGSVKTSQRTLLWGKHIPSPGERQGFSALSSQAKAASCISALNSWGTSHRRVSRRATAPCVS